MSLPSPYAPTPSILRSLARAQWGDLGGREFQGLRTVLRALIDLLDDRSASGLVTEAQVAGAAGLSARWTRSRMHALEDLGVIEEWRRGGIVAGAPTPSWVRVSKKALIALIDAARPLKDAADEVRRRVTAARIAGLSYVRARSRRSAHAELRAHLHPLSGEVSTSPPRESAPPPAACEHGEPRGPDKCPLCRRGIAG